MGVTIRDVARLAQVSIGTVSNVLNGRTGQYTNETLTRVMRAVDELHYRPLRVSRQLAQRRPTHALGVCFLNQGASIATNPYLTQMLDGVMTTACEARYNVVLFTRVHPGTENQHIGAMTDRSIDGLCLIAPDATNPFLNMLPATALPYVVMGAAGDDAQASYVDVDNAAGAHMAVDHLLALGHTRIAHVAGIETQASAQVRAAAFLAALWDRGIAPRLDWVVSGEYARSPSYDAAIALLQPADRPTAIVAANDYSAFGVLAAARALGLSIPGDVSVVGFDDIPESRYAAPPLTTISHPVREVGRVAVTWLVRRLRGRGEPRIQRLLAPALVHRGSTAAPLR